MFIKSFNWYDIKVQNGENTILNNCSGSVKAGETMAIMGPSGSGKTTLLNILSTRSNKGLHFDGEVFINTSLKTSGKNYNLSGIDLKVEFTTKLSKKLSNYVEQEDYLIGSLTVKQTLNFYNDLTSYSSESKINCKEKVENLIEQMGLLSCQNVKIGTVLQKGISGGEKRRVSIACQLLNNPKILFLDEPTSGLDSTSSYEIIKRLKIMAKQENLVIIFSIHQPSTLVFDLFDKVCFLSKGNTIYNGYNKGVLPDYFSKAGYPIPTFFNPSDYILNLINTNFVNIDDSDRSEILVNSDVLEKLITRWKKYEQEFVVPNSCNSLQNTLEMEKYSTKLTDQFEDYNVNSGFFYFFYKLKILLFRNFIKSYLDFLSYHARIVMYLGLSIMMGTVWLRLSTSQSNIQLFINAIFFSGAFMSFMSVAYIPSFIEDLKNYEKDSKNGVYGPLEFMLSNFLIGMPYLFLITILFSVFSYFMINFKLSATSFWYYVLWLFLDLLAAESMTVLISTILPSFVLSLAMTALANGLWMSIGGFLVSKAELNVFWYYTFYWINYQRYVFQGMMFNEFTGRVYDCDASCHCLYVSELASQCKIDGDAVLESLGYGSAQKGLCIGMMFVMIFVFRFFAYAILKFKYYT